MATGFDSWKPVTAQSNDNLLKLMGQATTDNNPFVSLGNTLTGLYETKSTEALNKLQAGIAGATSLDELNRNTALFKQQAQALSPEYQIKAFNALRDQEAGLMTTENQRLAMDKAFQEKLTNEAIARDTQNLNKYMQQNNITDVYDPKTGKMHPLVASWMQLWGPEDPGINLPAYTTGMDSAFFKPQNDSLTRLWEANKLEEARLNGIASRAAQGAQARASNLSAQKTQMDINAAQALMKYGAEINSHDPLVPVAPVTIGSTTVAPSILLDPNATAPQGVTPEQLAEARAKLTMPLTEEQYLAKVEQELFAKGIPPKDHAVLIKMAKAKYEQDPDVIETNRAIQEGIAPDQLLLKQRLDISEQNKKKAESINPLSSYEDAKKKYTGLDQVYDFIKTNAPKTTWYGFGEDNLVGGIDLRKAVEYIASQPGIEPWMLGFALESNLDPDTLGMFNTGVRENDFQKLALEMPERFKRAQEAAQNNLKLSGLNYENEVATAKAESAKNQRILTNAIRISKGLPPLP